MNQPELEPARLSIGLCLLLEQAHLIGVALDDFAEQLGAVAKGDQVNGRRPEDAQAVPEDNPKEQQGQRKSERQRAARCPNERFALAPEAALVAKPLQSRPYFFRRRLRTSSASVFRRKVIRNRSTAHRNKTR